MDEHICLSMHMEPQGMILSDVLDDRTSMQHKNVIVRVL